MTKYVKNSFVKTCRSDRIILEQAFIKRYYNYEWNIFLHSLYGRLYEIKLGHKLLVLQYFFLLSNS